MKKLHLVILIGLSFVFSGFGPFVARQDEEQLIEFKNKNIKPDNYKIELYRINYPKESEKKDKFFELLDEKLKRIGEEGKKINLIIPYELYRDLEAISSENVRESERIFYKEATSLSKNEQNQIDKIVHVKTPANVGEIQRYLNKQVAYWYKYLKMEKQYQGENFYTEFDKERAVREKIKTREKYKYILEKFRDNIMVEVGKNNITKANDIIQPLYIRDFETVDKLKKLSSKIILINNNREKVEIQGKIVLVANKNVENIRKYKFYTEVVNVVPQDIFGRNLDKKELYLQDILNFSAKEPFKLEVKNAKIKEKNYKSGRIKIREESTQWGIK